MPAHRLERCASLGPRLVAGRKASVDVARLPVPYSFHDINVAVHLYPSEEHRLGVSLLASNDDFPWDFLELVEFGKSIRSDWTNLVPKQGRSCPGVC